MPVWPYLNQNNYQQQIPPNNNQYLSLQSRRNDRHGWAQFIASQTNQHYQAYPQTYNTSFQSHQQYQNSQYGYQDTSKNQQYIDQPLPQHQNHSCETQVFCVDRVGLEHHKPPVFTQRYKVALPDNEEKACLNNSSGSARKSACFNCMETDHMISECPHPRDQDRIRHNRQSFLQSSGTGGTSNCNGMERYHGSSGDRKMLKGGISAARRMGKYANLLPGQFSQDLRNALGINDQQLPSFIYRMRELGYPPGWLQECLVYRNISEGAKEEYDFDRLITFLGFNQSPSESILNESELYGTPEYSEEMFGKESFIQSLLNSGCIAISTETDDGNVDHGDPMELDEEDTSIPVEKVPTNLDVMESSSSDRNDDEVIDEITGDENNDNEELVDLTKLSNWTESFLTRENLGDSIEESDCTPLVMSDVNINFQMPSIDKFADGINAHRFYENLPGVVGNFARIMETVKNVKKDE